MLAGACPFCASVRSGRGGADKVDWDTPAVSRWSDMRAIRSTVQAASDSATAGQSAARMPALH